MIKYGIHLGKIDTDPRAALAEIRAAGFDAVLLHLGGKYPNAQLADDIAAAGLVIDNVHAPWDGINNIWRSNEKGETVTRMLLDHMEQCAAIGVRRIVLSRFGGQQLSADKRARHRPHEAPGRKHRAPRHRYVP